MQINTGRWGACKKTLVCLANSRKPSGHCIAGKDLSEQAQGNWVRPVSAYMTNTNAIFFVNFGWGDALLIFKGQKDK